MDLPIVYIEKEPFLTMLLAVIETFRKESVGFLFGYKPTKNRNSFVVTNAISIQLTRRRNNLEVEQSDKSDRNLNIGCLNKYPRLFREIGTFHSHPEWGRHSRSSSLSKADIEDAFTQGHALSVVIKISSINKERVTWEKVTDGSIHGSLGDWKFSVNAWQVTGNKDNPIIYRYVIEAPAAIRSLNTALGYA
jgi:hypothetical protein